MMRFTGNLCLPITGGMHGFDTWTNCSISVIYHNATQQQRERNLHILFIYAMLTTTSRHHLCRRDQGTGKQKRNWQIYYLKKLSPNWAEHLAGEYHQPSSSSQLVTELIMVEFVFMEVELDRNDSSTVDRTINDQTISNSRFQKSRTSIQESGAGRLKTTSSTLSPSTGTSDSSLVLMFFAEVAESEFRTQRVATVVSATESCRHHTYLYARERVFFLALTHIIFLARTAQWHNSYSIAFFQCWHIALTQDEKNLRYAFLCTHFHLVCQVLVERSLCPFASGHRPHLHALYEDPQRPQPRLLVSRDNTLCLSSRMGLFAQSDPKLKLRVQTSYMIKYRFDYPIHVALKFFFFRVHSTLETK